MLYFCAMIKLILVWEHIMGIAEIIKELRVGRDMTQEQLAQAVGVSEQTINRYENGKAVPTFKTLSKLEAFFGVQLGYNPNPDTQVVEVLRKLNLSARKMNLKLWVDELDHERLDKAEQLLCLAGMYTLPISDQPEKKKGLFSSLDDKQPPKIMIPVVGRAAAGVPIEMIREYDDTIDIAGPIKHGDFAVIAVGDSMTGDDIHDGDRVVIRKQDIVEDGELALVSVDGGSTIKRVYFNGTTIRLEASNPAYNPQIYDFMHEVRILGKVIQVIKPAKS